MGVTFVSGPTHEEVVTDLVRKDVRSYRQLPVNLYQIQTKFRDEVRPRFGLMRGREFIMKDAYSFHVSEESLDEAYRAMHDAYCRVFEACGLDYIVVDADSGAIGGSASNEFMVVADTGEDAVVRCQSSGYAANVEKATTNLPAVEALPDSGGVQEVDTPGMTSMEAVAEHMKVSPAQMIKTLVYDSDIGSVAVAIRGDREVNDIKLHNVVTGQLGAEYVRLADEKTVQAATGAPVGFAGPVGLAEEVVLLADESVRDSKNFVCGANKADKHLEGTNWGTDAEPDHWVDVLLVGEGDPCPLSGEPLELFRGIEVGHIFKLGTDYSEAMGCNFTGEDGKEYPMIMGCYGLGVSRTLAAAIEQGHDEHGIVWPAPLAPFQVLLASLNAKKEESVKEAADKLYKELEEAGIEVLYDDRDERPGVKFKDADLVGFPIRVVVGARALAEGNVEFSLRSDMEKETVPVGEVVEKIQALLAS